MKNNMKNWYEKFDAKITRDYDVKNIMRTNRVPLQVAEELYEAIMLN